MELQPDFVARCEKYAWNPARFVWDFFKVTPDKWQEKALLDLALNGRLAVRSCHGAGKTSFLAWAALWWLLCHPRARVAWTAPTFTRQVVNIGFAEVKKWVEKIPGWWTIVTCLNSRIMVKGFEEHWNIEGVSSAKADNMEGIHGDYVMFIFDEAKGIKREIFDGAKGAMTKGAKSAKMIAASVPGGAMGYFFDIFNSLQHIWKTYHISAFESGMVNKDWIEECRLEWGEDNPVYISKVLGDFVRISENQLFPLHLVEAAMRRWELEEEAGWYYDPAEDGSVRIGADIAQFGGDETVVSKLAGVREIEKEHRFNTSMPEAEGLIAAMARREPKAETVSIDATGVGAGVADHCTEELSECAVLPVMYGANALTERGIEHYANRKAELYFQLRDAIKNGEPSLIPDTKTLAQLCALRYDFTQKGKFIVKEYEPPSPDASKSPDRADALALAWWTPNVSYASAVKDAPTIREKHKRSLRM